TVNKNLIVITFSASVVSDPTNPAAADNPANYSIFDPGSMDFSHPQSIKDAQDEGLKAEFTLDANHRLTISFTPTPLSKNEFRSGDWVNIVISGVQAVNGETL